MAAAAGMVAAVVAMALAAFQIALALGMPWGRRRGAVASTG